jgi:PAS domain S-box-containing protein
MVCARRVIFPRSPFSLQLISVRIQQFLQHLPGMFLVVRADAAFTIEAASNDYLDTTHTSRDILGKPVFDVFPDNPSAPESYSQILKASFRRVLQVKQADTLTALRYDVRRPEDASAFEERYWNVVNAPVIGDTGNVEFIFQRIDEASAKYRRDAVAILESITEGFFTLDRQWRFDYVNGEAHQILGRPRGTLEGRVLWEEYPGLEGTEFERCYRRTMHERERTTFTAFYPLQERWYEVSTFPAPEGVSVYFRNVTAGYAAQAELRKREEQLRLATEAAEVGFWDVDLERDELIWPARVKAMFGISPDQPVSMADFYAGIHPDERDTTAAAFSAAIDPALRSVYDVEYRTVGKEDGVVRWVAAKGRGVFDQAGRCTRVIGTAIDITARKNVEVALRDSERQRLDALRDADRRKDEFLATLAHELRNPLAPIRNAVQLMSMPGASKVDLAPLHAMLERQVTHMVRLVDDLMEASRISRGQIELRKEPLDIADVLRAAVESSRPLIDEAGHEFVQHRSASELRVIGDPVRLAQVFSNLLNNAARYTEPGGRIELAAFERDGQACVSVTDTGIGIAAEQMPRLFDMFSQVDRHHSGAQGGLGIGLSLSQKLVDMHGGTLSAYSAGLGQGSCFTVGLPMAGPTPWKAAAAPSAGELSTQRVLVVDDNQDAADSLAGVLAALGIEARVAYDGEQALAAVRAWRPQLVLLDLGMPGMDGYEVAKQLRSTPGPRFDIVALSGWGQESDRRRTQEAGFDDHLVKPVDLLLLRALLAGGVPGPFEPE